MASCYVNLGAAEAECCRDATARKSQGAAILGSGADVAEAHVIRLGPIGSEKPLQLTKPTGSCLPALFHSSLAAPAAVCEWRLLKSWSPLHNFVFASLYTDHQPSYDVGDYAGLRHSAGGTTFRGLRGSDGGIPDLVRAAAPAGEQAVMGKAAGTFIEFFFLLLCFVMKLLALDLQSHRGLDRQKPHVYL